MIIKTNEVAEQLQNVLEDTRKISKVETTLNQFDEFLKLINGLNSLSETKSSYKGIPLDEIKLPNWCQPFLTPTKIAIGTEWFYADLIKRSKDQDKFPDYDEEKVTKLARAVARSFKCDVQMSTFQDLRTGVMPLSACSIAVDGKVRQNGTELFYPIQLDSKVENVFGDDFFNMEESKMIKQYFARQFKFF